MDSEALQRQSDEEVALQQRLEEIFADPELLDHWYEAPDDDELVQEVVGILRKFPALASRFYVQGNRGTHRGEERLPLFYILFMRRRELVQSLELIREVHELYPQALEQKDEYSGDMPLHTACARELQVDIIEYIARAYPGAVTMRNRYSYLPVMMARTEWIYSDSCRSAFRILLEMNPDCIGDDEGRELVAEALYHEVPYEKMEFLARHVAFSEFFLISPPVDECSQEWEEFKLNQDKAKILALFLQKANNLVLDPHEWTSDGFLFMLDFLLKHDSVVKLDLKVPTEIISVNILIKEKLLLLITNNENLQDLGVHMTMNDNGTDVPDEVWELVGQDKSDLLLAIAGSLTKRSSALNTLVIGGLKLNPGSIERFLACQAMPRKLSFVGCDIYPARTNEYRDSVSLEFCPIEYLELDRIVADEESYASIMRLVARLPSIVALTMGTVCFWMELDDIILDHRIEGVDITQPVIALLQRPTLQSLSLGQFHVDMDKVKGPLVDNETLRKFHVNMPSDVNSVIAALRSRLARYNDNLCDVSVTKDSFGDPVHDDIIEYYMLLNQQGRTTARDPTTPVGVLMRLLVEADSAVEKYNIQYGLLREQPGLWVSGSI